MNKSKDLSSQSFYRQPVRTLVVDGDASIRDSFRQSLAREGFLVSSLEDLKSTKRWLVRGQVDLVITALRLPDGSSEELCRLIRQDPRVQGVAILVTAESSDEDVAARCLDSGADDYLVRPHEWGDFMAHVRALLRRPKVYISGDAPVQSGRMIIHLSERRVMWSRRLVEGLSPKEFSLLHQLVLHAPHVMDKNTLALRVWGVPYRQLHTRTLDVHIRRVRQKLGDSAGAFLRTIPAVGYQWRDGVGRE